MAVVVMVGAAARLTSSALPPVLSEVTVGLLAGLIIGNLRPTSGRLNSGIAFCRNFVLRLGIVLLGAKLLLSDIVTTGLGAIAAIGIGLLVVISLTLLLGRYLKVDSRLALLIAVGTSVCGNSAIVATAPVIDAEEQHVSVAIATITLFGILAVVLYPLIGHAVGFDDLTFGYWAGLAVNDTSQVTAAGFAYSQAAGETATTVKLIRNTMMGPLIGAIGIWYVRSSIAPDRRLSARRRFNPVPPFILGFLALALANSLGLLPDVAADWMSHLARAFILVALVAVGLSTKVSELRKVGPRPVYLGLVAALVLSVMSIGLIHLMRGA